MKTISNVAAWSRPFSLALSLLIGAPCLAQQSTDHAAVFSAASAEQTVSLAFVSISAPDQGDGYAQAHAVLTYRFMICGPDMVMGYRFDPASIMTSPAYWFNGNRIETPPKLANAAIRISGSVTSGLDMLGSLADVAAPVSGQTLTCSSSLFKIGAISDYLGPKATVEQVQHLIQSLSFRPAPLKTPLVNEALRAPAQQVVAGPVAPPPPSPAMSSYLAELQRSQQQTADFQAKRSEYEAELQAARDARAQYEAQYGPKPPKPPKIKKHRHKQGTDQVAADKAPAE